MSIKIKNIDPRPTDFDVKNLVINTKEGTIFYKNSNNELFRIQGDKLNTINTEITTDFLNLTGSMIITGSILSSDNISTSLTGSFGRVICQTISASSGDFDANTIRIGGTSFNKDELDTLKEGKSIRTTEKNLRGDDGNSRDVVVTRGIFSSNDDNTLIKLGSDIIGMVISGSSFFLAQKTNTENRIIAGDGNTQFNLSGSIVSASINGGSF